MSATRSLEIYPIPPIHAGHAGGRGGGFIGDDGLVEGDDGVACAEGAVVCAFEGEAENKPRFRWQGRGDEDLHRGVAGVHDDLDACDLLAVGEAFAFPLLESGGDGECGEFASVEKVAWKEPGDGAGPDFGFVVAVFAVFVRLAFAAEVDDVERPAFGAGAPPTATGGLEADDGAVEGFGEFDSDAGQDAGALEDIDEAVEV
jgi:hypothetical protein